MYFAIFPFFIKVDFQLYSSSSCNTFKPGGTWKWKTRHYYIHIQRSIQNNWNHFKSKQLELLNQHLWTNISWTRKSLISLKHLILLLSNASSVQQKLKFCILKSICKRSMLWNFRTDVSAFHLLPLMFPLYSKRGETDYIWILTFYFPFSSIPNAKICNGNHCLLNEKSVHILHIQHRKVICIFGSHSCFQGL